MSTKLYIVTIERRKCSRYDARIPAHLLDIETGLTIETEDGTTFDCVIANISRSGINITFDQEMNLPDEFTVVEKTLGTALTCSVIWRRKRSVGLRFLKVSDPQKLEQLLASAKTPELA